MISFTLIMGGAILKFLKYLGFISLGVCFLAILIALFLVNDNTYLTKINILTQLIYTFVTTALVILTYATLRATQQQKHQSIRPYLVISGLGIFKNAQEHFREEIDFDIYNQGCGLALNIEVIVKRLMDEKIVEHEIYTRLDVIDSPIYGALHDIGNEINLLRNNKGNGIHFSPYIPEKIHIEYPIEGDLKNNLKIFVEINYNDIYEKKYRNTFSIVLDEEEKEAIECVEKFYEL